ncbi:Crp/Fnr family transcriptional regulator [Sphingobacterium sp. DR205]|uniref:Crp/Fnr family transcriptional regulator n=1 Tax=Sphingobacterium sp. DR205 TaxID=2713573 RepID=UPI0013E4FA2E|nr:Crp/Fnr family transcriptional regulator [Sphingobacterium sp. DR205]QIH35554.1 Crp/Fnr family transcriptional regulator [Sphingobacterium sp. DR205]
MYQFFRQYLNTITSSIICDEEFQLIEEAFTLKAMKKKQFLLHEGTVCRYMAFIIKGAMRQYSIDDKGNEHIVRFGIEGWWMSDRESLRSLKPTKYNIDALEDCQLMIATNDQLNWVKEQSPLFFKMAHILDERHSIAAQHRIEASMNYTAEEKLKDLIKNYPDFLKRFPQNMLASYLGISPETFSRVRKQIGRQ